MTEKSASDVLRKLLEERGVKHETRDSGIFHSTSWLSHGTQWNYHDFDGYTLLGMGNSWKGCTPEQAIAATLGNSKSTADAIAELRKVVREAFSGESVSILVEGHAIMRAIDAVESATLGSNRDEIYNAGFDNGVKATLQQLEGIMNDKWSSSLIKVENIEEWIDEQWKEYES